jgi:hypothetical protein
LGKRVPILGELGGIRTRDPLRTEIRGPDTPGKASKLWKTAQEQPGSRDVAAARFELRSQGSLLSMPSAIANNANDVQDLPSV